MNTPRNSYCIYGRQVVEIAVLTMLTLAVPRTVWAIDVIGNLNVDTTWKQADSPVRLIGDVTVQSHVVLTIEPGTVVEAAATDGLGAGVDATKVELTVKGRILASGTSSDRIAIRGATNSASVWYGLVFDPIASESALTFVDISNAKIGIESHTQKPLTLSDLSIASSGIGLQWKTTPGPTLTRVSVNNNSTVGIQIEDDGSAGGQAVLNAVTVQDNGTIGLQLGPRVGAAINGSSFSGNKTGIDAGAGSALTLTSSVIIANQQIGLLLNQSAANVFSILNNTIDRNNASVSMASAPGVGLRVAAVSDASKFIVRNNNITNHGTVGVDVVGGVSPSLDHNNVWNNAANYSSGISAGTGSVSFNPLYRAPLLNTPFSHPNYPDNDTFTFVCNEPTATSLRVVFTTFDTETKYDKVQILSADGTVVREYSGPLGAFNTGPIAGSKVTISFTSDGSNHRAGFAGACEYFPINYRLQSTSPVIDTGNALGAPANDFDGIARPVDGDFDSTAAFDIGAFEFHTNKPPVAKAGADITVLLNKPVYFDGRASVDPDGTIISYAWNYGDGSAQEIGAQLTHTFTTQGNFTVTLTVTDDEGQTSTDTVMITVTDNLPPIANAGADQHVAAGAVVALDGSASTDIDGTITDYSWGFGDGTPAGHGATVTHTFANAGVYGVLLTVTDNKGVKSTDTVVITVGMLADSGMMMPDGGSNSADGGSKGRDGGNGGSNGGTMGPSGKNDTVGCGCFIARGGQDAQMAALSLLAGLLLVLRRRRMKRLGQPTR